MDTEGSEGKRRSVRAVKDIKNGPSYGYQKGKDENYEDGPETEAATIVPPRTVVVTTVMGLWTIRWARSGVIKVRLCCATIGGSGSICSSASATTVGGRWNGSGGGGFGGRKDLV